MSKETTQEETNVSDAAAKKASRSRRRRRKSKDKVEGIAPGTQPMAAGEAVQAPVQAQPQGPVQAQTPAPAQPKPAREASRPAHQGGDGQPTRRRASQAKAQHKPQPQPKPQPRQPRYTTGPRKVSPERRLKTPADKFGGREPRLTPEERNAHGPTRLTPFELFCAYHLGITEDNRYRRQNAREVARRFGCGPVEIDEALVRFGLDHDTLKRLPFELADAQLDMELAPEGIDKREHARMHFAELLEVSPKADVIKAAEQAARDALQE